MYRFHPDKRLLNVFLAISLLFHGLLLFVVWKLPVNKVPETAPPAMPVYIVREEPRESAPRVEKTPAPQKEPAREEPVRPVPPPPPQQAPPEEIRQLPRPLPDLPVSDELTDRPPSLEERRGTPSGSEPGGGHEGGESADPSRQGLEPAPPPTSKSDRRPEVALYDPGVVGRIVGPAIPYGDVPEVTLDTAEFKHLSYMHKLKDQIEQIWRYPSSAARQGITGDLFIRFVILADGSLGDVRLVRTSGYPELDEAALEAVREAAPFHPLPRKWGVDRFAIRGHFYYSLAGYYIR